MTENAGVCLFRNREVQGRVGWWWERTAGPARERVVTRLPPLRKLPAHRPYCPSGVVGGSSLQTRD